MAQSLRLESERLWACDLGAERHIDGPVVLQVGLLIRDQDKRFQALRCA